MHRISFAALAATIALAGAFSATHSGAQTRPGLKAECRGADAPFLPYAPDLTVSCDDAYLYLGSTGVPRHQTMVGITGTNRQVPIPQSYSGRNGWRIPLHPQLAAGTPTVLQGPMAVALNGVPIFDPTKPGPNGTKGDTKVEGELDVCNGHAGRADDYHYHAIPLCLQPESEVGQVVGFALDGFPVHTYQDADGTSTGLDECNGKTVNGLYGYYATKAYPYQIGCLRGVVSAGDQPQTPPLRPAGAPARNVQITRNGPGADGFNEMETRLQNGAVELIRYKQSAALCWDFEFLTNGALQNKATYCRRG